jgi:hypothetical protein
VVIKHKGIPNDPEKYLPILKRWVFYPVFDSPRHFSTQKSS